MRLRYAYNTNGLANHRLDDALRLLADIGYDGCALTLDHAPPRSLRPRSARAGWSASAPWRSALGLALSLETGARYLLDARHKHEPTLVSSDAGARARRVDLLLRAMAIAADLGAEAVSLWSGVLRNGAGPRAGLVVAGRGAAEVARAAEEAGVTLGFEPEPGMLVERLDDYARLREAVGSPALRLTLDLGHALLVEDEPPEEVVRRSAGELAIGPRRGHAPAPSTCTWRSARGRWTTGRSSTRWRRRATTAWWAWSSAATATARRRWRRPRSATCARPRPAPG